MMGASLWLTRLLVGLLFFVLQMAAGRAQSPEATTVSAPSAEQAEMALLIQLAKHGNSARKIAAIADIEEHPFIGDASAQAVIIEFGDFQCGFCRRHLSQVMPDILTEFVNTGRLQYVFWDFPVEARHTEAFQAAMAARCAQEQEKYWEMRRRLYISAGFLKYDNILQHATEIGLHLPGFESCMKTGRYADMIRRDQRKGLSLRVRGTPTFFLGLRSEETGQVRLMSSIIGAQPVEVFRREIEQIVNGEKLSASEH